jgi:translation initiation factor 2 subunit 2
MSDNISDIVPQEGAGGDDIFAGLKKKKKSKKPVDLDLDAEVVATPPSATTAAATVVDDTPTEEDLDFSELKKLKKKKKTVRIVLSDDEQVEDSTPVRAKVDALGNEIIAPVAVEPTPAQKEANDAEELVAKDAAGGLDEFADLKKKKRKGGKKSTFDLEAFEAELADGNANGSSTNVSSTDGTPAGSDGEDNGNQAGGEGEGEDPFNTGKPEGEDDVVLSKAEQAAEDKDWLKPGQTERDYSYTEVRSSLLVFVAPSIDLN